VTSQPTRTLGPDGPRVTRIGLGLAALGRPAYHNLQHGQDLAGRQDREALQAHCHVMLDAAWEAGVRYVDVARSYGEGEAFLRAWLDDRRIAPNALTIGSKWGYTYVGDFRLDADVHERKDHSLRTFRRQAAETRRVLGPHLDTYCIHSASLDSGVLDDVAVLDAMDAFAARHGIHLGLTATGPRQADTLRAVLDRHPHRFQVVHATFNLLEPSVGPVLREIHAAGLGVVVKEGVANGRLTDRTDLPDVEAVLAPQAARLGTTPDALALAWILAHRTVDVVLSGATTPPQLQSNLSALEVTLDDEAREALSRLARPAEAYWSARSALPWT